MTKALSMNPEDIADRELRLDCAKLAGGEIDRARAIYAFVTGEDAKSPAARAIEAVRELAAARG